MEDVVARVGGASAFPDVHHGRSSPASAAALAALGIYGLLAYSVTERQQELSVRLALGAQRAGVLWMVLRQGLALAVIGSAAGLAWCVGRRDDS